jgi:hypothetical protein
MITVFRPAGRGGLAAAGAAILCELALGASSARATTKGPGPLEFRADTYVRDLRTGQTIGEGNVRLVSQGRVLEADRIEHDKNTGLVVARGNVRLSEAPPKNLRAIASRVEMSLLRPEATLEDATLVAGTLVFSGKRLRRIDEDSYIIEEGAYSNCNLDRAGPAEVAGCSMDWKIVGKRITVDIGGYAHIEGAMLFLRSMPMLYLPYAVFPAKTERQSGLLPAQFTNAAAVGSGLSLPFFWAIGAWHDLTFTPTWYSAAGAHFEAHYRYRYSAETAGEFWLSASQRSYGQDPDRPYPSLSSLRGVSLGEFGFRARQFLRLDGRSYTRQDVRLVTDPFFTLDFPGFAAESNLSYQRSQWAYVRPGDQWLFAANAQWFQSLLVSKDRGVDRGPTVELPTVFLTVAGLELWDRYFTAEADVRLSYFYRPDAFDAVPLAPAPFGDNAQPARPFQPTDFLRTGLRAYVEPRLVATVPLPEGVQLQPTFKLGSLAYLFPSAAPGATARVFGEVEVPVSLYLQRAWKSARSDDFAIVHHTVQPRVSFVARRFFTPSPTHPFFQPEAPRFDVYDFLRDTESLRLELIQRVRRRTRDGRNYRLAWVQLGQNVAFSGPTPLGPVEVLADFAYPPFGLQLQGEVRPDRVPRLGGGAPQDVREYTLSSTVTYDDGVDRFDLTGFFRQRANPALDARSVIGSFTKTLPTFFDVRGSAEYSLLHEELRGFSVGLIFRAKPSSCWELSFTTGRNAFKQGFTQVGFAFDFGGGVARIN